MGAADPSSGTASVNEVVRGLGALMKKGWKPLRTIVICSWDGEGLISFVSFSLIETTMNSRGGQCTNPS
jgi:N-acetylated-alpha-linked acidic dipeptidase